MKDSSSGKSVIFLIVDSGLGDWEFLSSVIYNIRQDFVGAWVWHPASAIHPGPRRDWNTWCVSLPKQFDYTDDFLPYFERRIAPHGGVLAKAKEEVAP